METRGSVPAPSFPIKSGLDVRDHAFAKLTDSVAKWKRGSLQNFYAGVRFPSESQVRKAKCGTKPLCTGSIPFRTSSLDKPYLRLHTKYIK